MDWRDDCAGIVAHEGTIYLTVYHSWGEGVYRWRVRNLEAGVIGTGSCATEEKAKAAAEKCYARGGMK